MSVRERLKIPLRIREKSIKEAFTFFAAYLLISILLIVLAGIIQSFYPGFFDTPSKRILIAAVSVVITGALLMYLLYRRIIGFQAALFLKEEDILFHRTQLQFTPFPILFVDTEFKVRYANEKALDIYQTSLDELLGRPAPFINQISDEVKEKIRKSHRENRMEEFEVELPANGEMRVFQLISMPVKDTDGSPAGFVLLLRDITDLHQKEKEKEALQEQLIISQKNEALGRIAGNIAHDFNNLLTAVIGNAELLKQNASEEQLEMIDSIISAGNRGKRLVKNLLSFSQRQPIKKRYIEINSTVEEMKPVLTASLNEKITLELNPSPKPLWIYASESQVEQVLLNLVINARDAMPDGGRITISVREIEPDRAFLEKYGFLEPGKYVEIVVADTGRGIDPEVKNKIFDPYFTTKPESKGTGLGLSIVYGIVRNLGGVIEVYSEPGQGAEFHILIPESEASHADRDILPFERKEKDMAHLSVLLVEDDDMVRDVVKKTLAKLGVKINGFHSGKEALEHLQVFKNYYDLLIIDCVLADSLGSELYRQIREAGIETPVLFVSGYFNEKKFLEIPEKDRNLLMKPFTGEELVEAVKNTLGISA